MKALIYIGNAKIGEANLTVTDESMGVLSGQVTAFPDYESYRVRVQQETNSKGGANSEDFPFSIITEGGPVLQASGGVMLIDSPEFDEFSIEIAGIDLSNL